MERLESVLGRERQLGPEGRKSLRRPMGLPEEEGLQALVPPPGEERLHGPGVPGAPFAAMRAKAWHDIHGLLTLCVLGAIIFNILLAIWIFTDIRKRGEGSGIFIALALVAGIPAAIIYTLVRIGDKKA